MSSRTPKWTRIRKQPTDRTNIGVCSEAEMRQKQVASDACAEGLVERWVAGHTYVEGSVNQKVVEDALRGDVQTSRFVVREIGR